MKRDGKIFLALINDCEYIDNITDYIQNNDEEFEIFIFSDINSINDNYENIMPDILISDESNKDSILDCPYSDNVYIVFFSAQSEQTNVLNKPEKYTFIYKYQSLELIIKELYDFISKINISTNSASILYKKDFSGLYIYSILNISVLTPDYIKVLNLLKSKGNKEESLIIDMGCFSGIGTYYNENTNEGGLTSKIEALYKTPEKRFISYQKGLSDIIYYVKSNNNNLKYKMKSIISNIKEADIIYGVSDVRDLWDLEKEDITDIFNTLKDINKQKYIYCFFSMINESFINILLLSKKIILKSPSNEYENYINKEMLIFLDKIGVDINNNIEVV